MSEWFEVVQGSSLEQGDILANFPLLQVEYPEFPIAEGFSDFKISNTIQDVVITTQSCDLVNKSPRPVLVCPVFNLDSFGKQHFLGNPNGKEQVRRGYVTSLFMLQESKLPEFEHPIRVIDFKEINPVPFPFVKKFVDQNQKRLRLKSPYREHLSQAFARNFMRVGLPADIPNFVKGIKLFDEGELG